MASAPKLATGLALLVALVACGREGAGPRDRVRQFGECRVPAGAVQVEDLLQGDGVRWTFHAVVVMSPSRLPEFVEGCGFAMSDLRRGYEHEEFRPTTLEDSSEVAWWRLPEPNATAGTHRGKRHLFVVERDTDVAAFIYAEGGP